MNGMRKNGFWDSFKNSHFIKILLIGFLILLLQIPIYQIRGVIEEREQTREDAVKEVTEKWGRSQSLIGPCIIVPYINRAGQPAGSRQYKPNIEYATFLPEDLKISGKLDSRLLYRGIYEIPVYSTSIEMTGSFARPDFSEWTVDPNDVLWGRAYLSMRVTDAWAMTKSPKLLWNNRQLDFLPSAGEYGKNTEGVHVSLEDDLNGENFNFSFSLELNGSVEAFFVPFGRDTEVHISSDWNSPSFQGTWLPKNRKVDSDGFEATWNIPFLSRNYAQKWLSSADMENDIMQSKFGVEMISPVDHYRMSQRSVKYQILFLVLTFATLWLFEVLAKIRVHPVQYLLIGVGMCLFYLLELSLAEHFGFIRSYIIASAAIIVLVTSYSAAVLKTSKRAIIVGLVVTLLYIYLYVLLMIEDYALLAGSIGLFVTLAAIMFLTRKVDWYSLTDVIVAGSQSDEKLP
ncbi:MAG: cell envelope integrity protein CreD [Sedimentisphaerales bacterium]|nr:cell envelope integrity protein CreD [Sedimentisphaerales bacterium]